MESEKGSEKSLEERMAACPIHTWADVEDYLRRANVPQHLWNTFHELIIARGHYPPNISDRQAHAFGKEAHAITVKYNVTPEESRGLLIMFQQLVEQWIKDQKRRTSLH